MASYATMPIEPRSGTSQTTIFNQFVNVEDEQITVSPSGRLESAQIKRRFTVFCEKEIDIPLVIINEGVTELRLIIDAVEVKPTLIPADSSWVLAMEQHQFNDTLFTAQLKHYLLDKRGGIKRSHSYYAPLHVPEFKLNRGMHIIEIGYTRLSREIDHRTIRRLNGNEITIDYTIGSKESLITLVERATYNKSLIVNKEIQKVHLRSEDQKYIEYEVHSIKYFPYTNILERLILFFGEAPLSLCAFMLCSLLKMGSLIKSRVKGQFKEEHLLSLMLLPIIFCFGVYMFTTFFLGVAIGGQFYDQVGMNIFIHIFWFIVILITYPIFVWLFDLIVKFILKIQNS